MTDVHEGSHKRYCGVILETTEISWVLAHALQLDIRLQYRRHMWIKINICHVHILMSFSSFSYCIWQIFEEACGKRCCNAVLKITANQMYINIDISVGYQSTVSKTHMKKIYSYHEHICMPFSVYFYFIWQMLEEDGR